MDNKEDEMLLQLAVQRTKGGVWENLLSQEALLTSLGLCEEDLDGWEEVDIE